MPKDSMGLSGLIFIRNINLFSYYITFSVDKQVNLNILLKYSQFYVIIKFVSIIFNKGFDYFEF